MALESSSPYGVGESTLSSGKPLFPDTETVEKFPYPYNSSGNFTSVFNNTPLSNAVLNTSVGHSTPYESKKVDKKPSALPSKFKENMGTETQLDLVPCLDEKFDDSAETTNLELTGRNVSSDVSAQRDSEGKAEQDDLSETEDLVECGNCDNEFQSLQEYMDHTCAGNKSVENVQRDDKAGSSIMKTVKGCIPAVNKLAKEDPSDVESFDGKIVYNPDGSAYIFEGDSDSDIESMIDLPQKEGVIIDRKGRPDEPSQQPIPLIDNAFFVPRNPNSFMNNSFMLPQHQTPIMHSYRVYDLRSGKHKSHNSGEPEQDCSNSKPSSASQSGASKLTLESSTSDASTSLPLSVPRTEPATITSVPTKPILMCFICKLSFGFSKSFISHASSEHSMALSPKEHEIMAQKNSSAIIQGIGKDKEPLMSFLEPIKSTGSDNVSDSGNDVSTDYGPHKSISLKETTSVSYVYTKPKLSDSYKDSTFGLPLSPKHSKDLSIKDMKDRFGKMDDSPSNSTMFNSLPQRSISYESSEMHGINEIKKIKLDLSDSDSQSSFPMNPLQRQRYIPEDYKSQPPKSYLPTPYSASQMPGFYGVCDEHPNGRAQGVECPSCDMVLSSSQSLGGHMTMMHSRNSCKTLKCPKCNWHYKYQETLEIHMKEKHPEGDQKCMYCLTNQPHPRLARGESYSCGYKPYRCEVCNYSTTTKGNLSIHIQSDKHLNNVQDLAHGNGDLALQKHQGVTGTQQMSHPPTPTPPAPSPAPSVPKTPPHQSLLQQHPNSHPHLAPHQQQQQHHGSEQHHSSNQQQDHMKKNTKPKPTWRCDVCNYETNVARNLRIHMTSEKHTHNMMVLQQNMKHMQRDMQLHQMNQLVMLQQDPSFMGLTGPIPGGITFPYDGSLMMGGMPPGFGEAPMDLSKENGVGGIGPEGMQEIPDVNRLFQCCVCNVFGTDTLESLHQHLQLDRTKMHEHENITVSSGTYMCNLCQYKTNLKANFQLHCKTDKHIQRLQLVNHIKEGGANNEWRLKYLNVSNPVQVRCNACDYYTNSIHKLQIHTGNPRHEASTQLFCHLQSQDSKMSPKTTKYYQCTLCKFNARSKLVLMQHVHSMQHLHSESMKQLEMKEAGQLEIDIGDIFTVREMDEKEAVKFDDEDGLATDENGVDEDKDRVTTPLSPSHTYNNNNNTIKHNAEDLSSKGDAKTGSQVHECPYCTFSSVNEMRIKAHIVSQHTSNASLIACPLCQEPFSDKSKIEKHLTGVHNVNSEGLHKLLALVDDTSAKMPPMSGKEATLPSRSAALAEICEINLENLEEEATKQAAVDAIDLSQQSEEDKDEKFRCQTCSKSFSNIDELYSHQNELGHLQLKQTPRGPGYLCWKKGCNQYFKTAQALQMHFREIHAKSIGLSSSDKLEYKYPCQMCTLAFKSQQKLHIHAQLHIIKAAVTCTVCSKAFTSMSSLRHHVASIHDLGESDLKQVRAEMYGNALALASFITDPNLSNIFKLSDSKKQTKVDTSDAYNSMKPKPRENGEVDSDMSSKENSPSSTPHPLENGVEKMDETEDNGNLSKEDQAVEDYLNSLAFAEDYDNPNRKFKCHRCQLAFTKQHYLSAHNKTLLHKKGDRLTYPMEKYLDPNRPYKCDICKESFTQHNILLVHYNSVSHLHKVKQAESGVSTPASTPSPQPHTALSLASSATSSSAAEKHSSTKSREPSPAEDEGNRPYKCNICRVSYSQGSTLDIHIRSVAHQTRASKLKELALNGEVDLTRPLIEEPIDKAVQAQQQKMLNELAKQSLSQQSLLFPGLPGLTSYPGFPGLPSLPGLPMLPGLPPLLPLSLQNPVFSSSAASSTSSQPLFSSTDKSFTSSFADSLSSTKALEKISESMGETSQSDKASADSSTAVMSAQSQSILSGNVQVCTKCSAVFPSQDSYNQHQLFCSGSPMSVMQANRMRMVGRVKPAVQRNLLENFGFECVMQFNEFNQRSLKKEEEAKDKSNTKEKSNNDQEESKQEKTADDDNDEKADKQGENEDEKKEDEKESKEIKVKVEPEEDVKIDLPEMNRCVCAHCNKQFSSVWVLKAHKEEVHKDMVPIEKIEEFGDQFKTDFEQSIPVEVVPDLPPAPAISPVPVAPVVQEEKVVKQEMPPPPPPPPAQVPMVDMLQMMNMFNMGMMHMQMPLLMSQPSLMPMMMPPPGMDNVMKSPGLPGMESAQSNMMAAQQKQYHQNTAMANQKRARTRINDDQLKVLRGYFDINNSPSEEQIQAMSDTTGLPQKVIKHWFRNTLFKERQRNKDSPYNFNNPPSTTLDLEEYEKTGKLTIVEDPSPPASENPSPAPKLPEPEKKRVTAEKTEAPQPVTSVEKKADPEKHTIVKSVRDNKVTSENIIHPHKSAIKESPIPHNSTLPVAISSPMSYSRSGHTSTVSSSLSAISPSYPPASMTSSSNAHVTTPKLTPSGTNESIMQRFEHGLSALNSPSVMNYPPKSTTPTTSPLYDNHNYSPPGGSSSGRRANRTRFTDYQIKCLQEYFEQNAYPKDDELEHLSKMLELSPRVIVVWFQNARQKARKIYENQPADGNTKEGSSSSSTSPFNRTPGLNYQCKKCQSVFQRYYDLIRHQKRHCFSEHEKQESHMMSDDSDSMSNVTSLDNTYFSDSESESSSVVGKSRENNSSISEANTSKYRCEKCNMSFHHAELFKEHQALHSMNPGLFMNLNNSSAFGVLQSMANTSQPPNMEAQSPNKRKYEMEEMDDSEPRDKRLRTTILPEQLDYLYQKYQIDCNPSRKQLEAISKDVGLKKRVVQVWFQNTRARERKGQYRAHQQLIHKRCPICRALFRAKSALESHLATKHPDEMAKGDINIDTIPDAAIESPGPSSSSYMPTSTEYNNLLAPPGMSGLLPYMPPGSLGGMGFPPMPDPIQMSMKQFYEDSFKKYISDLSTSSQETHALKSQSLLPHGMTSTPMKAETKVSPMEEDAPLDLSKPVKPSSGHSSHEPMRETFPSKSNRSHGERHNSGSSSTQDVLRSAVDQGYMMRRFNESMTDNEKTDEESSNKSSCPASPGPSMSSQASLANKRYRTQMTSLQVRIMKQIFIDYKTPTMAECEMLGRIIGLQKRVVQVWFQNARAKEKKAKLNMAKTYGQSEMDFPKPPEECTLCNFKYSHKYTIQDHIFTKKHIDKVKEFIQTRADAERELSSSSGSVSGLLRSQQSNDIDHMRKLMEEANAQTQMAHLQSMGLGPLGMPPGAMAGMMNLGEYMGPMKKEETPSSSNGKSESSKHTEGSSKKKESSRKSLSAAEAQLQSMNMLSPFGMFPGVDPAMIPYMYPGGMPGMMSGMPGVPSLQPGLMPGAEHLLGYDPMTFGTPLSLLQIPQQAIKDVSSKLAESKASVGQYTQDCKSISSLRSLISGADYNCVREAIVDVGYICKKCQMVYPAMEACVSHQRMMCFSDGKIPDGLNAILKLEQIQYECKLCSDKMSTVQDFKSHCESDGHRRKLPRSHHSQKNLTSSSELKHTPVSTPSSRSMMEK